MPFKLTFYTSDVLLFIFMILTVFFFFQSLKKPYWQGVWKKLIYQPVAIIAGLILSFYFFIAALDSIHLLPRLPQISTAQQVNYSVTSVSLLDVLFKPLLAENETSYSRPFALHAMTPIWVKNSKGEYEPDYLPLKIQGVNNFVSHFIKLLVLSLAISGCLYVAILAINKYRWRSSWRKTQHLIYNGQTAFPYRTFLITSMIITVILTLMLGFCFDYHLFGTDKIGHDVFYEAIKSIRTGLLIGSLTMLFMLPLAISMGMLAGYFGGKIDDAIQYLYTTLSSIPGILLIVASVLSLQIFIANHPNLFSTINQQADLKLIALCVILGLTGWAGLCRVLRAETFKLREMDYVAVAKTLGSSTNFILKNHIFPNLLHIIIISVVLDFSGLVLAEAVLTYIGVGVDPSTMSWGNMIDAARLELARQPIVWWPLTAAFSFMFVFVLALNLFGDALRNALDPRSN